MNLKKLSAWVILILILTVCILLPLTCKKPKTLPSTHTEDSTIDSLNKQLKSDEQIKNIANNPDLSDDERDSLFTEWEKETGLSRFRDSFK